jgi:hypothetical protein
MKTIAAEWREYNTTVLPSDAGAVQRRETRRAFYAGAHCMLTLIARITEATPDENTGGMMIEALNQELQRFNRAVLEGHA